MAVTIAAARVRDATTVESASGSVSGVRAQASASARVPSVAGGGGAVTHGRQLDTTNTGPEAAGYTVTNWTGGSSFTTPGQVIEGKRLSNTAVLADNVTFRGCEFRCTAVQDFVVRVEASNTTFEDCRWRPAATNTPPVSMAQSYQQGIKWFEGTGMTVRRCEFWGFGNAIEFEPANTTQSAPLVVEECWMHDAAAYGYNGSDEYHHDGILCSFANDWVVVRRCKIASLGNTNALAFQTTGGAWGDLVIEDNYFSGFGWTINLGDDAGAHRVTFTGNDYSTEFNADWGAGSFPWFDADSTWSGNHWVVPAGAQWGQSSWNGNYWWPNDAKNGGHATEYAG
jgi:hypothetical protein